MDVWVVGESIKETPEGWCWDFHGVFTSEALAVARCLKPTMWIGPYRIDTPIPLERQPFWPGAYYPSAGKETANQSYDITGQPPKKE